MRLLPVALFTLATACSAVAQTYTLKTLAGGALPENLPGLSASLGNVYGIAIDRAGNIYLSLGDYDMVARIDVSTGVLTRVAGNGTPGFSGDNGPAASAQLSGPTGLAVDSAGNLYIADAGNLRVRMVSNGTITTIAGAGTAGYSGDNGPATAAQFNGLDDLAVDTNGNLYIADFYNQAIREISNGIVTTMAGNGTFGYSGDKGPAVNAQLAGPSGIVVDSLGNVYIAEGYNNRVRKVSNGIITTVAGNGTAGFAGDTKAATSAMLKAPTDVAADAVGNLYVADYGNNRVRMVSATGIITTFAGNGATSFSGDHVAATSAGLGSPRRIAVDALANLYLVDGSRLRKIASGVIATTAGGAAPAGENGPAAAAQLASPQGLATDAAGNLYVSDAGTGRVLEITGGTLTRVAGAGNNGFGGDNQPATSAQLSAPAGVAVDLSGNLYVADSLNARIRKISSGIIVTVAGGGSAFGDNGPATSALLGEPQSVAVDAAGDLYLADLNRVRMVSGSSGVITTVVGNGSGGYQGDGGPATAAYLASPAGIALDSAGNLFLADTGNNRIRKVVAGTIATVAGNGTYGFSSAMLGAPAGVVVDAAGNLYVTDAYRVLKIANGKITTIAGLSAPQGIAVDAAGNVYVAEPSTHRVRLLTPAGTSCAVTVAPASLASTAAGGALAAVLQTGPTCPWTIENLPAWISVSGDPFGAGPATASLAVASNPDVPRSATITIGGQNVVVAQAGTMTIAGLVTLQTGGPLSGVTVSLSGSQTGAAITDSGGNYSFPGLNSAGSYTVTPSLAGYTFVPASQTFSHVTSNPSPNFSAWVPPAIAGLGPAFGSSLVPAPKSFAAGEIITIYGVGLCSSPASAALPLPDRLAACMVQVDGSNLRLGYGSPAQINAVLQQSLALGSHQLVVQRYTDTTYRTLAAQSQPLSFTVDRVAMAFVERTEGTATLLAVQYLDGGFAGPARPLHPADYVVLYLTGLGRKAQTFPEGAAPKTTAAALEPIQISVEGQPALILYAGDQPQYPGLDQITLQLPKYTLGAGSTVTFQIVAPSAGQSVSYAVNSY